MVHKRGEEERTGRNGDRMSSELCDRIVGKLKGKVYMTVVRNAMCM